VRRGTRVGSGAHISPIFPPNRCLKLERFKPKVMMDSWSTTYLEHSFLLRLTASDCIYRTAQSSLTHLKNENTSKN
jgi:hypothetical protein